MAQKLICSIRQKAPVVRHVHSPRSARSDGRRFKMSMTQRAPEVRYIWASVWLPYWINSLTWCYWTRELNHELLSIKWCRTYGAPLHFGHFSPHRITAWSYGATDMPPHNGAGFPPELRNAFILLRYWQHQWCDMSVAHGQRVVMAVGSWVQAKNESTVGAALPIW